MKITEYWDKFDVFSGKLSDLSRQSAFAGIAIIWIFKNSDGDLIVFENLHLIAILFFLGTLVFDLCQYLYATIAWNFFCIYKEKKIKSPEDNPDFDAPNSINYPTWFFFILKIISLICGFTFLFSSLLQKIKV